MPMLAYVESRWRALSSDVPPEQLDAIWNVFAGAVAVGLTAALQTRERAEIAAIVELCKGERPLAASQH